MTALTHMAAARPPGIADARVPCPLCGGLIHPVAGRCKHCKEDLTAYRGGRPQAAAALPALLDHDPHNGHNGHAVATANALVQSFVPPAQATSQPILPPRTTARSVEAQRPHGMWRSWPMLVIVVAAIAIVAATVIMVMPQDREQKRGTISTPPAPERMQTNPLPDKQSSIDPWAPPGTVPQAPAPVQPPSPVDPDDDDIWGGLGATPPSGGLGGRPPSRRGGGIGGLYGGGGAGVGPGASFMITALDRACTKLKSCPDLDQSTLSSVCDTVAVIPKPRVPTGCAEARRCLDAIDRLDCSDAASVSPHSVFTMFNDCALAATQC
jgi:hypothetical protein